MTYEHAAAWAAGPDLVYRRMAAAAVGTLGDIAGWTVLDAGAGTGAASRAISARGGSPIGVDLSRWMLRLAPTPAAVADVHRLPLRDRSVDACVACCLLSHVDDPETAVEELRRVTAGPVVATAFTGGPMHPTKQAADAVLERAGYRAPDWYQGVKTGGEQRATDLLRHHGARELTVELTDLTLDELAAWRLGMAHVAGFVAALSDVERSALTGAMKQAIAAAGAVPPVKLLVGRL